MFTPRYIIPCLAALPALAPVSAWAQPPTCDGVVAGRVVEVFPDSDEPFGLFEARVTIESESRGRRTVETDLEGNFWFDGLCGEWYVVGVELDGYEVFEGRTRAGQSMTLVLELIEEESTGSSEDTVSTTTKQEIEDSRTRETLDERELDESRGASLGETLEQITGVRTIDTGTVSKPVIQGMHSARLAILFDGLRHHSQSWGLDHAPEIDPFDADSISVVKGAAGVRYGPDAIGGAILVEPRALPTQDGFSGDLYAVGLSNGLQGVGALSLQGGMDDGFGWRVLVSGKKAGALSTPNYVLDNTGTQELNLSIAAGIQRENWGVSVSGSRVNNDFGVFIGNYSSNLTQFQESIEADEPLNVDLYRFDYEIERPRQEVRHSIAKASTYVELGDAGRLEATAAYQHNERREYDIVRASYQNSPQLDFTLRSTTLDMAWVSPKDGAFVWSSGLTGMWQENVYRGRRYIPNYRRFAGGAFAWLKYIGERVELEVGARADGQVMTTYQREAVGGASAPVVSYDLDFVTPSAVLGARAKLDDEMTLSVNLSSASRAPTINELFVDGVSQGVAAFERGDIDLDPEQTWAATATFDVNTDWFAVRLAPYAQFIDGYIYSTPRIGSDGLPDSRLTIVGAFPYFTYEQVDAIFAGVDADVKMTPFRWLELETSASMVRARDVTNDGFLVFIPPDEVAQSVTLKARSLGMFERAKLGVRAAFTAEQTRVDLNADFAQPPPGYVLVNAFASAEVPIGDQSLFTSLEVTNVTDQRYRSYLSRQRYFADEPGRSINLRLKYSF